MISALTGFICIVISLYGAITRKLNDKSSVICFIYGLILSLVGFLCYNDKRRLSVLHGLIFLFSHYIIFNIWRCNDRNKEKLESFIIDEAIENVE